MGFQGPEHPHRRRSAGTERPVGRAAGRLGRPAARPCSPSGAHCRFRAIPAEGNDGRHGPRRRPDRSACIRPARARVRSLRRSASSSSAADRRGRPPPRLDVRAIQRLRGAPRERSATDLTLATLALEGVQTGGTGGRREAGSGLCGDAPRARQEPRFCGCLCSSDGTTLARPHSIAAWREFGVRDDRLRANPNVAIGGAVTSWGRPAVTARTAVTIPALRRRASRTSTSSRTTDERARRAPPAGRAAAPASPGRRRRRFPS
jgi:hypothetical protein